ncbi:MAG: universal stress protein [Candidatus Nanopelagicales bacterium]|jgi:nucleotide-binding universal stress UspA family protein|nr:universal stress protein [Candidatus Nanopelagicales bacterium]
MTAQGQQGIRRLVFADDGSQHADVAWLWVVSQTWPGWTIEAVTVDPDAAGPGTPTEWTPPHPRAHPEGTPVTHLRAAGPPPKVLAGFDDRDLLVVGPRGHGLKKDLGLGSTSDALLRDPPIPVVIARRGVTAARVLVCADGSPPCLAAVDTLASLPLVERAAIAVVTVPEPGMDPEACNAACAARLSGPGRAITTEVLVPDPTQVAYHPSTMLLHAARSWGADLVVLGHRGLSGLQALRAGSIASTVAHREPGPVLVAAAPRA